MNSLTKQIYIKFFKYKNPSITRVLNNLNKTYVKQNKEYSEVLSGREEFDELVNNFSDDSNLDKMTMLLIDKMLPPKKIIDDVCKAAEFYNSQNASKMKAIEQLKQYIVKNNENTISKI